MRQERKKERKREREREREDSRIEVDGINLEDGIVKVDVGDSLAVPGMGRDRPNLHTLQVVALGLRGPVVLREYIDVRLVAVLSFKCLCLSIPLSLIPPPPTHTTHLPSADLQARIAPIASLDAVRGGEDVSRVDDRSAAERARGILPGAHEGDEKVKLVDAGLDAVDDALLACINLAALARSRWLWCRWRSCWWWRRRRRRRRRCHLGRRRGRRRRRRRLIPAHGVSTRGLLAVLLAERFNLAAATEPLLAVALFRREDGVPELAVRDCVGALVCGGWREAARVVVGLARLGTS